MKDASLGLRQAWKAAQATRRAFMVGDRAASLDVGYGIDDFDPLDDLPPGPPGMQASLSRTHSLQRANSAESHVHPNSSKVSFLRFCF